MGKTENEISIKLGNGFSLVASANVFTGYPDEIFIGVRDQAGIYIQDLVVVRGSYEYDHNGNVRHKGGLFDVLVWADVDSGDFTHDFSVSLRMGDW